MRRTAFVALMLAVSSAAASARPVETLDIVVLDYAAIAPSALKSAEGEVARIFRTAHVRVDWPRTTRRGTFFVVVLPERMAKQLPASADALGSAPGSESDVSVRRAYVFADRISALARDHDVDFATLLGCTIAHELAHMLLPAPAHTPRGLMAGNWDPWHLPGSSVDMVFFTRKQGEQIRERLRAIA